SFVSHNSGNLQGSARPLVTKWPGGCYRLLLFCNHSIPLPWMGRLFRQVFPFLLFLKWVLFVVILFLWGNCIGFPHFFPIPFGIGRVMMLGEEPWGFRRIGASFSSPFWGERPRKALGLAPC